MRGSWRSDNYAYSRWTDWLGDPLEEIDPAAARVVVARHYLHAFGPATTADFQWWTGWTKRDTVGALSALHEEIVSITLEDAEA